LSYGVDHLDQQAVNLDGEIGATRDPALRRGEKGLLELLANGE
jgi:hypothetical protein